MKRALIPSVLMVLLGVAFTACGSKPNSGGGGPAAGGQTPAGGGFVLGGDGGTSSGGGFLFPGLGDAGLALPGDAGTSSAQGVNVAAVALAPAKVAYELLTELGAHRDDLELFVGWTTYLTQSSQFVLTGTLTEQAAGSGEAFAYLPTPGDRLEVHKNDGSVETFRCTTLTGPSGNVDANSFNAADHRVDCEVANGKGYTVRILDVNSGGASQQSIHGSYDGQTHVSLDRNATASLATTSGTVTTSGVVVAINERMEASGAGSARTMTETFNDTLTGGGTVYGLTNASVQMSLLGDTVTALSASGSVTQGGADVGQLSTRNEKDASGATRVTVFAQVGTSTSDLYGAVLGSGT